MQTYFLPNHPFDFIAQKLKDRPSKKGENETKEEDGGRSKISH